MYSEGEIPKSLLSPHDLRILIDRGENVHVEFKKTIPSPEKIAREISALANTQGGLILVGVADNGAIVGIRDFYEEEHWIQEAAGRLCRPRVEIHPELIHLQDKDVLLVRIDEAPSKPVYVRRKGGRTAYVRLEDESVTATLDAIRLMRSATSQAPLSFEYGEKEQFLFRYLHEYGEITVRSYSDLAAIPIRQASTTLVALVNAGVLSMFNRDREEVFCFSKTV